MNDRKLVLPSNKKNLFTSFLELGHLGRVSFPALYFSISINSPEKTKQTIN
jgi:hypothetical protein